MRPALLLCCLLGGCATPTWDQYPGSLYTVLRTESPAAINSHRLLLKKLYEEAEKAGKKPPAGIAAEYAYYSWKIGEPEAAKAALAVERQHYPESAQFLTVLERFLPSVPVVSTGQADSGVEQ